MGTGTTYYFTKPGEVVIGGLYNNLATIVPVHLSASSAGGLMIAGATSAGTVTGLFVNSDGTLSIGGTNGDDEVVSLLIDDTTRAVSTIDYAHHEIHEGDHWFYTDKATLGESETQEYMITPSTDTTWSHLTFQATGSAITQVDLYEDTTRTGTTDVTFFNSNRNTTDSAETVIYKGASTDGADGTLIYTQKSGASSNQSRGQSATRTDNEIILKQGSKYLMRFTSSTASNLCNLILTWYEHTNV